MPDDSNGVDLQLNLRKTCRSTYTVSCIIGFYSGGGWKFPWKLQPLPPKLPPLPQKLPPLPRTRMEASRNSLKVLLQGCENTL